MFGEGKYDKVSPFEKLHQGEPWFFLRAQDKFAPEAVEAYAAVLDGHGMHTEATEVRALNNRIKQWQQDNPNLTKIPD